MVSYINRHLNELLVGQAVSSIGEQPTSFQFWYIISKNAGLFCKSRGLWLPTRFVSTAFILIEVNIHRFKYILHNNDTKTFKCCSHVTVTIMMYMELGLLLVIMYSFSWVLQKNIHGSDSYTGVWDRVCLHPSMLLLPWRITPGATSITPQRRFLPHLTCTMAAACKPTLKPALAPDSADYSNFLSHLWRGATKHMPFVKR